MVDQLAKCCDLALNSETFELVFPDCCVDDQAAQPVLPTSIFVHARILAAFAIGGPDSAPAQGSLYMPKEAKQIKFVI